MVESIRFSAPLIARHSPNRPSARPLLRPSAGHPLGTDDLGQDLLARMLYGGRISIAVGFAARRLSMGVYQAVGDLHSAARAFLFSLLVTASLAAQSPRFGVVPGPRPGGGEVKWSIREGGRVEAEKDGYTIFEGGVTIEYQDIKLQAEKVTYNLKTKDVVAEGNVIIDQGPTRVAATRAVRPWRGSRGTGTRGMR